MVVFSSLLDAIKMKKIKNSSDTILGMLNASPKNIAPDMAGIIMEDVVISMVICIGPYASARILKMFDKLVATPKITPKATV